MNGKNPRPEDQVLVQTAMMNVVAEGEWKETGDRVTVLSGHKEILAQVFDAHYAYGAVAALFLFLGGELQTDWKMVHTVYFPQRRGDAKLLWEYVVGLTLLVPESPVEGLSQGDWEGLTEALRVQLRHDWKRLSSEM